MSMQKQLDHVNRTLATTLRTGGTAIRMQLCRMNSALGLMACDAWKEALLRYGHWSTSYLESLHLTPVKCPRLDKLGSSSTYSPAVAMGLSRAASNPSQTWYAYPIPRVRVRNMRITPLPPRPKVVLHTARCADLIEVVTIFLDGTTGLAPLWPIELLLFTIGLPFLDGVVPAGEYNNKALTHLSNVVTVCCACRDS